MGVISELSPSRGWVEDPRSLIEARVTNAVKRLSGINWFPGVTPDPRQLQEYSDVILVNLGLSPLPVRVVSDQDTAQRLYAVRDQAWKDAWSNLQSDAIHAKDDSKREDLWLGARTKALEVLKDLDDLRSKIVLGSVKKRAGAYVQWQVIEDYMFERPNPCEGIVRVNELGGAALGPSKGTMVMYFPQGDYRSHGRF